MPDREDELIAEWLMAHEYGKLAWTVTRRCSLGHHNDVNIYNECMAVVIDNGEYVYCGEKIVREPVPRDFTYSDYLLDAVEAYCTHHGYGWRLQRIQDLSDGCHAFIYGNKGLDWHSDVAGHGSPMRALREVLVTAIDAEKGERHV